MSHKFLVACLCLGLSAPVFADMPTLNDCHAFAPLLLGATYQPAVHALARVHGLTLRVVSEDDKRYPVTMDYRVDRVNLGIKEGRIATAICG